MALPQQEAVPEAVPTTVPENEEERLALLATKCQEARSSLVKPADLQELKALASPPAMVVAICRVLLYLTQN